MVKESGFLGFFLNFQISNHNQKKSPDSVIKFQKVANNIEIYIYIYLKFITFILSFYNPDLAKSSYG